MKLTTQTISKLGRIILFLFINILILLCWYPYYGQESIFGPFVLLHLFPSVILACFISTSSIQDISAKYFCIAAFSIITFGYIAFTSVIFSYLIKFSPIAYKYDFLKFNINKENYDQKVFSQTLMKDLLLTEEEKKEYDDVIKLHQMKYYNITKYKQRLDKIENQFTRQELDFRDIKRLDKDELLLIEEYIQTFNKIKD